MLISRRGFLRSFIGAHIVAIAEPKKFFFAPPDGWTIEDSGIVRPQAAAVMLEGVWNQPQLLVEKDSKLDALIAEERYGKVQYGESPFWLKTPIIKPIGWRFPIEFTKF